MKHIEKIPKKTIERLTIYLKCLEKFPESEYICSEELGVLVGVTAPQIRKDLSYFIEDIEDSAIGIRGKGYSVKYLSELIRKILGIDKQNNVIIVGAGRIGNAVLFEGDIEKSKFNVVGIFDVTKSRVVDGIKVRNISEIPKIVKEHNVEIAIIAEIKSIAQQVTDIVVKSGVKAILNLTPMDIQVPIDIKIEHIDLNKKLQELNYWKDKVE